MESENILTFIKAIDKQYFSSFINDGQIFMNTIKWFRNYEKQNSNIGDKFEGVEMAFGKGFTLNKLIKTYDSEKEPKNKMDSANWTEIGKGFDFRYFHDNDNANIFCLYVVNSKVLDEQSENYLVPKKFIDEFSNHRFVIFLQPYELICRMKNAISRLGKTIEMGKVHYYNIDEKLSINLSNFHKRDIYSYQNEFRILFKDENAVPQIINIGSLNDICLEIDINRRYKIELMDNNQFSIKSID
jgi:hypothetical protein